ncbi:hypothetical protein WA171_003106, partial [Blastocystis sp. BT1]
MKFDPLYGHNDGVNCLTYWNTIAASGSDDHTVRLWDLRTMGCINILDGFFNKRIVSICHNPRMMQQLFVACGNQVLEFDLRNLATVVSSYEPEDDSPSTTINCMCIDPEGYFVGTCNSNGNIDIFNVYTHEPTRMMNFDRTVNNIAFYRQGKNVSLMASGDLTTLYNYSMTGEKLHETVLPVLPDTEEGLVEAPVIRDICINYDENMTYVGCDDGSIRCVCPSGKDIALENYIICKPHSDSVKKVTTGKNMEGSNLVFSVGADSRMSICSKTANGRRFDQQLHVKLRNIPNSLCFVDTLTDNAVLSCSNSN